MKSNPKLNSLHESFACILCAVIKSDGKVSDKEMKKFNDFFSIEFGLDEDAIQRLYKEAMHESNVHKHTALLKEAFEGSLATKARFMQYLNATIVSDGIEAKEYELFESLSRELV